MESLDILLSFDVQAFSHQGLVKIVDSDYYIVILRYKTIEERGGK